VVCIALLEGRRSIRLSYGRVGCIDSKSFIASWSIILKALTLNRVGRRSIQTELQANSPTIVSSSSYSDPFNGSNVDSRSIQSNWCFFGQSFKAQTLLSQLGVNFVASVRNQIIGRYVLIEIACLVSTRPAQIEIVSSNQASATTTALPQ